MIATGPGADTLLPGSLRDPDRLALVLMPDNHLPDHHQLSGFWTMPSAQREALLLRAIARTHTWHYGRNRAYQRALAARGIGADLVLGADPAEPAADAGAMPRLVPAQSEMSRLLPRLLRPAAQAFKSYIEILGTPFPQDCPYAFLDWLADQLSVELPRERFARFRPQYRSLEALLLDLEAIFANLHLKVSTSSGTSGRATIMVRDAAATEKTVESFYLAFQRYLGIQNVDRAIFVMPRQTRIAMARMAAFSVKRLGLADDRIHFAIPFPAEPDRVRIRAGRTYRPGWSGVVERRFWHPFMNWMQEHVVTPRSVRMSIDLLSQAGAAGERVLLFGGWVQLHAIAQALQQEGRTIHLPPGSLLGTGGGLKELYPYTPARIRQDLSQALTLANGEPIPIRDVYGMAEGNWAAMQCREGNYHVPPWIYARTLDEDGFFREGPDTTGLLAFFDPYGGGRLFPAFFKTADRVRLIRGGEGGGTAPDTGFSCACGEPGAYISRDSIQRVDLLDEAGCAAQV